MTSTAEEESTVNCGSVGGGIAPRTNNNASDNGTAAAVGFAAGVDSVASQSSYDNVEVVAGGGSAAAGQQSSSSSLAVKVQQQGVMDVLDEPQESPRNSATGHVENYRNSFTADSPYFSAFADRELKSLSLLGQTLQDVSDRTKTFVRTGELMCAAAKRLSSTCMLRGPGPDGGGGGAEGQSGGGGGGGSDADLVDEERRDMEEAQRKEAVGDEMAKLLRLFGEVRTKKLS